MEERRQSRTEVLDKDNNGPGIVYSTFVSMESLLEKLKLLNYDSEFVQEFKMKFLNKHYFAIQTNPGEQFFMFSSIAAWLIRKSKIKFDSPQEFDDPNGTIASILEQVKQMGVHVDFPPSKLKQGWGEHVILVLSHLADEALKRNNFTWKRAIILPNEDEGNDSIIETDDAEVTLEKIEEEMIAETFENDSEEEGEVLDLEALRNLSLANQGKGEDMRPDEVMESNLDVVEWKMEIERVMHHLKVTVRNDSRDWRSHLDQIRQHRKNMDETLSTTKLQLDKLHSDISRSLEKIGSREKYLNNQLEQLILEYRTAQDQLSQVKEQYKSVSGGVTERSRTLSQITEELDQVKQEMDERGSNMTDGKPLVNIRKALSKLKVELSQMDVRIGVASHTLLQAKLKEKGNLQRAINNPPITIF
ncbi:intraflagellar transport protein 57 homolog [Parasteatoda tepidariorum]|uniref:intraflagellar transport protein 57 homolog n=1 Tax=Parasteatoda tepidariorum TaxID=114398 RepID=UPI00077FCF2F|nr:intraflagellar transport protein 57 homolog [Parasteatoda tepidariorum]XP_015920524.1 intraflagellar transport protein 57 homolog [Parasteatoda tepidariorum]XP_015920598.1 intraflagellar transport protein 57 homolog [Parasteatoda tepidariorum]